MRLFEIKRKEGPDNIHSSPSVVCEGVEFTNGKCAVTMKWLIPQEGMEHTSIGIYDSIEDIKSIIGRSGLVEINWKE